MKAIFVVIAEELVGLLAAALVRKVSAWRKRL